MIGVSDFNQKQIEKFYFHYQIGLPEFLNA